MRDGLRNVKNVYDDLAVIPGAGAFQVAAHTHLTGKFKDGVEGKAKLGVQAFADALLVIPKTLALNSGLDIQETLLNMQDEGESSGIAVGMDVSSGEAMDPMEQGIVDNVKVVKQAVHLSQVISSQLLLVDEVIKAGRKMK